ncbi:hypothetical protein SDC9_108771 [bioreactor metagenome]|uniref:Uncharacterized protein n=1 Tax=bioreactor metagenome TaxID=1076179 RepID=A0A645B929_9ZZZZ
MLEQNESYQADYRAMQFSTIVANLLSDAFGGVEYARLITIKSMAQNDDGSYTVNISYPDPEAVYRMLARAYEDSFNQQFYGDERIAVLSAEGIADIDLSTAIQQNATVVLLYHRETGESSLLNDGGLAAQVASAKAKAEAEATAAINAAWRVEPLEPPPSGSILEGESAGNAIQFKASDKLGTFFYVRFYAISSDDTSEEGTLALGVFIQGGKTAKFKLPSGYYRVSCLVGNSWYGLDHLFGSDSKTYDGGNAVRSRAGYQNNISFE